MVAPRERVTVEEFQRIIEQAEKTDRPLELINGEIIEKMPTQLHALIVYHFIIALHAYLQDHPIAWVFPEARYELPDDPDSSFIPDISVVLREGRTPTTENAAPYMPELAIEIQSPKQSDKFMVDKGKMYLAKGAKLVWIVYPRQQLVEVLTPSERHLLTINDTLTGGDVLPGFSVPIREIFPKAE